MGNTSSGIGFHKTHEIYRLSGISYDIMPDLEKFFSNRESEGFQLQVMKMQSGNFVEIDTKNDTLTFFIQVPRHRMSEVVNYLKKREKPSSC